MGKIHWRVIIAKLVEKHPTQWEGWSPCGIVAAAGNELMKEIEEEKKEQFHVVAIVLPHSIRDLGSNSTEDFICKVHVLSVATWFPHTTKYVHIGLLLEPLNKALALFKMITVTVDCS